MKHKHYSNTRASKKQSDQTEVSGWTSFAPYLPPAAAMLSFLVTLSYPLLGVDDHAATVDNPAVKNIDWVGIFSQFNLGMYAPLTWLGYSLAHALGGEDGFWYHFLSVLAHTTNAALLYRLLHRISGQVEVALGVALLFAIHPVQVESVAWVAAFSTPLSALFMLLGLLAYTRPETAPNRAFAWALVFFVLACLAKSTAVVLALLIPLMDWWRSTRRPWYVYASFLAVALAFGALTLYSRAASGAAPVVESDAYSLTDRFFMVCYTPIYYWGKLLLPLKLNMYYAFEKTNGQFPWYYYASPALLSIVFYVAWKYRATQPYMLRGLWWYGANIIVFLPLATVGTFELCADHYNYLAGAGIFYLLLGGGAALSRRFPATANAIKIAGFLWILAIWTLSFRQVRSWKSTLNLFSQAIANGHYLQGKMYYWRGVEYGDTGNMAAAMEDFNQAIQLDSAMWDAYRFRGSLLAQNGQLEPALQDLQIYLRSDTTNAPVWNNVAMINVQLNKLPEALQAFTRTIEIKPDAAISYSNRARLYLMMGDTAKAQADLEIAKNLSESKQQ